MSAPPLIQKPSERVAGSRRTVIFRVHACASRRFNGDLGSVLNGRTISDSDVSCSRTGYGFDCPSLSVTWSSKSTSVGYARCSSHMRTLVCEDKA